MTTVNNAFYIIVNKQDGKFEIVDNNNNVDLTDSPNAIIGNSTQTGKFKVKVDIAEANKAGYFNIGSKYYRLDLDNIDFNELDVVNTSQSFKEKSSAPVVTDDEKKNGGQKQKQQKSKRNYSKKRRSSKSKSDTLRNYFNYDHLQ